MSKKIIYTDEFGNKININSIEGIHVILNDIKLKCTQKQIIWCTDSDTKDE